MFIRRRKRRVPGLNTTSTADISFILLVFFLVISSMDSNKGIRKLLPPAEKDDTEQKVTEMDSRNVLEITIGKSGQLMVDGRPLEMGRLKERVAGFVRNCPQRSRHVVNITMLPDSRYDDYFHVQDAVTSAYAMLRNRCARSRFHKPYAACSDDTQGCILVGENKVKGMVVNSRIWLHRLMKCISEAREKDESVWITII